MAGGLGAWEHAEGTTPSGRASGIQPGSKVVLQVHYNTQQRGPEPGPDLGAFKRWMRGWSTPAYVLLWADASWIHEKTMGIPAGQADVMHRWAYEPSAMLESVTRGACPDGQPITVYAAALHMHTLGTRARLGVLRGTGGDGVPAGHPALGLPLAEQLLGCGSRAR